MLNMFSLVLFGKKKDQRAFQASLICIQAVDELHQVAHEFFLFHRKSLGLYWTYDMQRAFFS